MSTSVKRRILTLSTIVFLSFGMLIPSNTVKAATGDTTVYITKTGSCYHKSGCSSLRKSKIAVTLQDAVDRGKRPCKNCKPGSLDETSAATDTTAVTTTATTTVADSAIEALKTYKGNTEEFNAYTYYKNYEDLQTAIGAVGDALLKHWNDYGKAEGRVAK